MLAGYNQLRQNYLNKHFQAKVGKELPKQFPEPLLVGKLNLGNFAFSKNCKQSASQMLPGRVKGGNLLPDLLLNHKSPVGNFGGVDCMIWLHFRMRSCNVSGEDQLTI